MEDKLLIIMLAVLVVLGFGAILFFSGMLSKKRRQRTESDPGPSEKLQPGDKGELLDEFDRTGILCFDKTGKPGEGAAEKGGRDLE